MLIKAAINGGRRRIEHAAVPVSPAEQAADVVACLQAGAGAVHLHVRATSVSSDAESLDAEDVARTIPIVRAATPKAAIGVSTGAWILPHPARLEAAAAWEVLPDFASVNFGEKGAAEMARLLLSRGVDVEAGLCDAASAEVLMESGLAASCIRVLLEPQEQEMARALENVNAIEKVLEARTHDARFPPLLHGVDATAWPLLDEAIARGYDVRIGLEDTLVLPDGRVAKGNVELVTEAVRRVRAAR